MVVINTHISYKTKDGATGDAEEMQALRESEIGVITTWISNTANYNREKDGPLVLAGDFNINQGNSVFDDYKNGSNGFYFAREEAVVTDTGRTFNNWGVANGQLTIDFQFYKGFSSVQSYSVDRDPYADVTYISDHWPLSVVYEF